MKKARRILKICIAIALAIYALLLSALNFYIIPQKIIPRVRQYLDAELSGPVRVKISDIDFIPLRGFVLKYATLSVSLNGSDACILSAPKVRIDLRLSALLWKQIRIKRLLFSQASVSIARDENGAWNFAPLLEMGPKDKKTSPAAWKLVIDKVQILDSSVEYADIFKKENSLRRVFNDVQLSITRPRAGVYKLDFDLDARRDCGESCSGSLEYEAVSSSLKGKARFNIRRLSEYRDYYLDDMLRPWDLVSDNIAGQVSIERKGESVTIEADYKVGDGLLRHGDFSVSGDYAVRQKLHYIKGNYDHSKSRTDISLDNAAFRAGGNVFLNAAKCSVAIAKRVLDIQNLSGVLLRWPVYLNGKYSFDKSRLLVLAGKVDNFDTKFSLSFMSGDQAQMDFQGNGEDSYFKLHADISDLKQLVFDMKCEADVSGPHLTELLRLERTPLSGRLSFSGGVSGEADKLDSYEGSIGVGLRSLSFIGLQPLSCAVNTVIQDGVLYGQLPEAAFYNGQLSGAFRLDYKRWGCELHLERLDIKELSSDYPRLKGLTGIFNGMYACAAPWDDISAMQGGGYARLLDCDLRSTPMFRAAEQGLVTMIRNFIMPVFNEAEGNFLIKDKRISLQNVFCKATTLNLGIKGGYDFSGKTDFTVGVSLLGGGITRAVKQIFSPFSLGVNLLANSFEVDIWGKWPEFKHSVNVRPQRWLEDFLGVTGKADPQKYSLEKIW